MADTLLNYIDAFVGGFSLKYNKYYIGLMHDGTAKNFVAFGPRKTMLCLDVRLKKSDAVDEIIDKSNLDLRGYDKQFNNYCFRLKQDDLIGSKDVLMTLFKMAYEAYTGNKLDAQE